MPGAVSDTLQYSPLLEGYTNYYVKIEELKVGDEALDLGTLVSWKGGPAAEGRV